MMDDFDRLQELIKDEALASIAQVSGQSNTATLVEHGNHNYTLRITGIPNDTIAFRTDGFPAPKLLFKNSRHECKRADYVIVARKDRRRWIIYVDMKSTKDRRWEIVCQLRGAKCVVAYCRAIIGEFWGDQEFLNGYAEHFVSVKNIGINKRPTREPQRSINNNPEDVFILPAPRGVVQFGKLLK